MISIDFFHRKANFLNIKLQFLCKKTMRICSHSPPVSVANSPFILFFQILQQTSCKAKAHGESLFSHSAASFTFFFQPEEVSFIYLGQKVSILISLHLYNRSIFISDKWIVSINNQREQRTIKKQFHSWHLRWLENKIAVKFYKAYDHFSYILIHRNNWGTLWSRPSGSSDITQDRIANRLWNISYQNRYYS